LKIQKNEQTNLQHMFCALFIGADCFNCIRK